MTDEQRRTLDPSSQEYRFRVNGSKTQLVGWSLYTLLLWTLKLCMTIFYSRLTWVQPFQRISSRVDGLTIRHRQSLDYMKGRIRIGYAIVVTTYVATELSVLLGCHPFHKNWQIYPDPGSKSHIDLPGTSSLTPLPDHCQPAISKIDLYVTVILNVLSDLYLLSIPIPVSCSTTVSYRLWSLTRCVFSYCGKQTCHWSRSCL